MSTGPSPITPGSPEPRAPETDPAFLAETLRVWQPLYDRPLTPEDAREIVQNVTGFFRVLQKWDAEDRKAQAAPRPDGRERVSST